MPSSFQQSLRLLRRLPRVAPIRPLCGAAPVQPPPSVYKRVVPLPTQQTSPPPPPTRPATFDDVQLHASVRAALVEARLHAPLPVQRHSIPAVSSGSHTLIAAETGAGKTLAYLLPLLSALKTREDAFAAPRSPADDPHEWISPSDCVPTLRPSILVLQPTRELAAQVASVARGLAHTAKLRVRMATKRARVPGPVDLLVATPGAARALADDGVLTLSSVRAVVLDEADELLAATTGRAAAPSAPDTRGGPGAGAGAGFVETLAPLLKRLAAAGAQHVYAAATAPRALRADVTRRHKGEKVRVVTGARLHRATGVHTVRTAFVRLDGGNGAKMHKATEIVGNALTRPDSGKMLVFCDGRERRSELVEMLVARGVAAVRLGGDGRSSGERSDDWDAFRTGSARVGVAARGFARGIDDTAIGTIVLVDVPMTGGEYLHRVGRLRGKGRVFVLVGQREHAVAEALFLAHVTGERIDAVEPKSAWQGYTTAGRDRLLDSAKVRSARSDETARWVDERQTKEGSFRGRVGRKAAARARVREERKRDESVKVDPGTGTVWVKKSKGRKIRR